MKAWDVLAPCSQSTPNSAHITLPVTDSKAFVTIGSALRRGIREKQMQDVGTENVERMSGTGALAFDD